MSVRKNTRYIKHYLFFKFTANGGHHNYSSFIIHYIKSPPSFQTTDLDIN